MDILVTSRLTLRPPLDVDADLITQAFQNRNTTRMLSRVPQPYSSTDAKQWIDRWQDVEDASCFVIYGRKLMGAIAVELRDGQPDLGYWLDERHWGQGYMTEAARAVLPHVFLKHGYTAITSGAYEDNHGSLGVLTKLGFEPDGKAQEFNMTRNANVPCQRFKLTRERFESLYDPLEDRAAA